MEFVAIDVETANADLASICQIGMARFSNGVLTDQWKTYVDPQDHFSAINVSIHGINEALVAGAPTFAEIDSVVSPWLRDRIVVTHTAFDRVSVFQARAKCKLSDLPCSWLDSACVARRAWTQFARSGYGLKNVCDTIGYKFQHHDALEDAKAAAQIVLAAIAQSGLDLDAWLIRVREPIEPILRERISRDGNPDGKLYGEVLVFTGELAMPRREAADLAAHLGCRVESGVTKRTTLLVVGDQDVRKLAGHNKSSKQRKAEELVEAGQPIRIVRETDFRELVALSSQ